MIYQRIGALIRRRRQASNMPRQQTGRPFSAAAGTPVHFGDRFYTMCTLKLFLVIVLISSYHADPHVAAQSERASAQQAITKAEFIFERAPFPSCHASTLAETNEGIVAA